MKESWCIATNRADLGAAEIVQRYARRFTIEETFRDIKDNRFGMGLSATNIRSADRRDRLLFISAIAQALLTRLGAAGEVCGLDRILKTNTVKTSNDVALQSRFVLVSRDSQHARGASPTADGSVREDRLG